MKGDRTIFPSHKLRAEKAKKKKKNGVISLSSTGCSHNTVFIDQLAVDVRNEMFHTVYHVNLCHLLVL